MNRRSASVLLTVMVAALVGLWAVQPTPRPPPSPPKPVPAPPVRALSLQVLPRPAPKAKPKPEPKAKPMAAKPAPKATPRRTTPTKPRTPRRSPRTVRQQAAAPPAARARPEPKANPAPRRRTMRASDTLVRRGRALEREGRVPGVGLQADDEAGYLAFFSSRGGRLFVECQGRVEREVDLSRGVRFHPPRLTGLDVAHPRSLQHWRRGQAVLAQARREIRKAPCGVVLLLPHGVHARTRQAIYGAIEAALGPGSIGSLARIEGAYVFSGGRPSLHISGVRRRDGSAAPLDLHLQL